MTIPTVCNYYTLFRTFVKWFPHSDILWFMIKHGGGLNYSLDFLYIRHAAFNTSHHHLLLFVTHFYTLRHTHYNISIVSVWKGYRMLVRIIFCVYMLRYAYGVYVYSEPLSYGVLGLVYSDICLNYTVSK